MLPLRLARAAGMSSWTRIPAIAVLSPAVGDPRVPLVRDAVAFWNRTLAELGSGFRLGTITETTGGLPAELLIGLSSAVVDRVGAPPFPEALQAVPGHLVVALSEADFVSFCQHWWPAEKALVAIKSDRNLPLTLPNVARNVIAHELGHAIGLGHNSDPTMLMCGRPAPCRPNLFASDTEHYFPLTALERATLLNLYPSGWQSR
jgi:hypothetical protein